MIKTSNNDSIVSFITSHDVELLTVHLCTATSCCCCCWRRLCISILDSNYYV